MRYAKEQKEQSRRKILKFAGKEFRRRGIDGIGIAEIMKGVGLTVGAFYGHFDSKEELVREALREAYDSHRAPPGSPEKSLEDVICAYLSPGHRDGRAGGCPTAALVAEVARQPAKLRATFTAEIQEVLENIAARIPASDAAGRERAAIAVFAQLVGSLQLARAVDDEALSARILHAGATAARALAEGS